MNFLKILKRPSAVILLVMFLLTVPLSILSYHRVVSASSQTIVPPTPVVLATSVATRIAAPTAVPDVPLLSVQNPAQILGIEGNPGTNYAGIPWVRLAYRTCNSSSKLFGALLKDTIRSYHKTGIRVLLTFCQGTGKHLYDQAQLNDAALSLPDAVQCGNEEMKLDAAVAFLYVAPQNFATFYNACDSTMHTVRRDIPVLLGSLDPHVGGIDVQQIQGQVDYLNQMQTAMNKIRPGSHWNWHTQILGLIDSWHNGYPDASVNNLASLFTFWAQQFGVDLNSGQLGKHLWVVEGTGCFKGCGVDDTSKAQIAIAHILSLTTNVQTVTQYKVPFFYFSGKDFVDQGIYWPIGVLDFRGREKPIRQDLALGARTLTLSCSKGKVTVKAQLELLAKLYAHCTLPANYSDVVTN